MSDDKTLTGELQNPLTMSEVEWLEYETLILDVSDFSDTSEIDGLLCMAWLGGAALASVKSIEQYLHAGEDAEALPRVIQLVSRHAAWVEQRCASQPEELAADLPRLSFSFDFEDEQWAITFDAQLWLLGWQRGVDDFPRPELGADERLTQAFELIGVAAAQTSEVFDSEALDEAAEDYAEELLDLATPAELAISAGVAMTVELIPRILPTLRETDAVALDDQLAQMDADIEQAFGQMHADAEEFALESGEGLYSARMDWVSGNEDRLPEGFYSAASNGRLAQAKIAEIEAFWNAEIVADGGLPFEYVDGFLSAHYVTPNNASFDLQHTLFPLFAEQSEQLDDEVIVEVISGLEAFHGHVSVRGVLDADCEQLVGVPAQVDRHQDRDEADAAELLGARWSEGFRAGLSYFCPVFGTYLQQDKMLFALMLPMIQLSFQPEGLEHDFTLAERRELVAGIPETLVEIAKRMEQQARTPVRQLNKVGRNDPCPCGSGKKYKKCCGAS